MERKDAKVLLGAEKISILALDDSEEPFCAEQFTKLARVEIKKIFKNYIEFDLFNVDASIANAIRRVAIAEVPTMAIETVYVVNNTSVIPDEVLAHRLGLIPIHADPRKFDYMNGGESTDVNTIVLELCQKNVGSKDQNQTMHVYSEAINWIPQGSQASVFKEDIIRPCLKDILVAKLRKGQEIDLELYCVKGIGKDHAKWSPVSAASYRLCPSIQILEPITGEDAKKFAQCFSEGVIQIKHNKAGVPEAVVASPRLDTVSRECLRHPEFATKVALARDPSHYIFQIETVGFFGPTDVIVESLQILIEKCDRIKSSLFNIK